MQKEGIQMSIFNKTHTLITEAKTIGAYVNEAELQYQFVNLSLGELCPATIIYPTLTGEFKRIDTLRAYDFYVCCYPRKQEFGTSHCDNLCINISKCLYNICYGASCDTLSKYLSSPYKFHYIDNLEYLEFTCPISGLIKYAFPIKFNKLLICIVFIGQFSICKREIIDHHNSTLTDRLKKQFESEAELSSYISQKIVPEILRFTSNTVHNFELSERNELTKLLHASEKELNKAMIDVLLYDSDSDLDDYSSTVLNLFWKEVRSAYYPLLTELGAHRVTLYIDDDFSDNNRVIRHLCGMEIFSPLMTFPAKLNQNDVFDTNQARELCTQLSNDTLTSNSVRGQELLACFRNLLVQEMYQYDYVYSNNATRLSYAILIVHGNTGRNLSDTFVSFIKKIATNIRFELSSVLTKLSEHATKSILRIYRHEIVHQVLALRTSINSLNPDINKYISPEKIANIFYDCSDSLSELSFMTENIKLFTGQSNTLYGMNGVCAFETIDIFKDVINKHIAMHRELRSSKHLWFGVTGKSEFSHKLQCYPLLLDLLLFNIVSNAVKYAYHGTNIWFEYSIAEEKYQTKQLVIRDYGSAIPAGNEIYRLYYRGPDVANVETGSGIGLYISKRLADIMGVSLYHKCKKISDYNISLMEKYIDIVTQDSELHEKNALQVQVIQSEILRLKKEKKYSQIINLFPSDSSDLCDEEILADISLPTYEVSFVLEL